MRPAMFYLEAVLDVAKDNMLRLIMDRIRDEYERDRTC